MSIKRKEPIPWRKVMIAGLLLCIAVPIYSAQTTPGFASETGKKKILYVNSYDLDFNWSLRSLRGALAVLNVQMDAHHKLDDSASPIAFKILNMKTKKNRSIEYIKQAALEAKALIETWQPDVVICADDNASKYLIVPYFNDTDIPFVFCGVNWDASEYGFPRKNVTGMIEVFPVQEALNIIRPFAKGSRVGFLSSDTLSEHKNAEHIRKAFNLDLVERYAKSLDDFEQAYKEIQKVTDILFIIEVASMIGFDNDRFKDITNRYISIPTISFSHVHFDKYLLTCKRVPEEQGEWAAKAALEILDGKLPEDIPVAMNKKAAIRLNMKLAKKLGIKFPMELIERSSFVSEDQKD